MVKAKVNAAALAETTIPRRDVTARDLQMEIFFRGAATRTLARPATNGTL